MSKASDVFEAIIARVKLLLPSYAEIPDPLLGPQTTSLILAKGFSVAMGPGLPRVPNQINCEFSINRSVQIQLTRLIENTANEAVQYRNTVKSMFDDQLVLLKSFEADGHLGNIAIKTDYISDNGILPLDTVNQVGRFLDLTTTFEVAYKETIE